MTVEAAEPPSTHALTYMLRDQRRMALAKNYYAWQARLVRGEIGARVIDAGCGIGNFTARILDRELVVAVDHDAEAIRRLAARRHGPNLRTVTADIAAPEFRELARFGADSCVCLNVLEHIEDDRAALSNMAAVVRPGGTVVLLVPAFPALYGPVDRNLGHYRRYRRGDIRKLAAAAGLQVRRSHYFNSAGFFAWWFNARVLRREEHSPAQIRFYDRSIVPALSRLESFVRPPFGQSLFAVLEKP
jgi:SAM-dependent methyltransferase